jgi:hypothetical protein
LVAYYFTDTDPTVAPESVVTGEVEVPLQVDGPGWQAVEVDVPASLLNPSEGPVPNMILPYLVLAPPSRRTTVAWVDDVELVAWWDPSEDPDVATRIDRVHAEGPAAITWWLR